MSRQRKYRKINEAELELKLDFLTKTDVLLLQSADFRTGNNQILSNSSEDLTSHGSPSCANNTDERYVAKSIS